MSLPAWRTTGRVAMDAVQDGIRCVSLLYKEFMTQRRCGVRFTKNLYMCSGEFAGGAVWCNSTRGGCG